MKSALFLAALAICVVLATSSIPGWTQPYASTDPTCPVFCRLSGVYNLPHFQNCDKFYRCTHGFFAEFTCPEGTSFDHVLLRCVDYFESDCLLHHEA